MTFVFVHLPKTAGTSFRHAFEVEYPGRLLLDYREGSHKTSEPIRQFHYESSANPRERAEAIRRYASETGVVLLCGHFRARKYWDAFDHDRFVVFLRNPLDRIISAYNHKLRNGNLAMSFEEFALTHETNLQSVRLKGTPLEEFGFVGLSERYREAVALFNARFGLRLGHFTRNRAPVLSRQVRRADLPASLVQRISDLNAADMALYERAVGLFERRMAVSA